MAIYYGEVEMSFNNRAEVLPFPVVPESIEIHRPTNTVNYETTEVGTYKAIGNVGLISVSLKGFYPNKDYSFCKGKQGVGAEEFVNTILRWQETKRPIRLIVTDVLNEAFAIESFTYSKEEGTGDILYTFELEQYRFAETGQGVNSSYADELITIITLVKGQTLQKLAEEHLGNSDLYKDIAKWNDIEDVGHPWVETEKSHHQLQIICKKGMPCYDRLTKSEGQGFG